MFWKKVLKDLLTFMTLEEADPEGPGIVVQELQVLLYEQSLLVVLNTHQRST